MADEDAGEPMADGMGHEGTCPRCGASVLSNARWCPQCGLVRVGTSHTPQPRWPWTPADLIATTLWALATIVATALWYQWLTTQTPASGEATWGDFIALVIAPLLGLTVGFGVLAGALIRRHGSKVQLLALACLGAACMVFTVYGIASTDPTQCSPNSGCDLSYGFGAVLEFPFVFVPFLAGTAIGRGLSALLDRVRAAAVGSS
jgi:hypothetical protein